MSERRAKAFEAAQKLGQKLKLDPVSIQGPLATTWWGKAWNRNLEGYADYTNRLPRGRSYARHGSVINLRIDSGSVEALVQGSRPRPYEVRIDMAAVKPAARKALAEACSGRLDSAEALLGGRFPEDMERLLTAEKSGLFPHPRDIRFSCSCPDSAALCKHIAAALYGVGSRLDRDPSLFFRLRKVEMEDLVSRVVKEETRKLLQSGGTGESTRLFAEGVELGAIFGIDLEAADKPWSGSAPSVQIREKTIDPESSDRRLAAGKIGRRKGRLPEATLKKIQSAMESIEASTSGLAEFEAELKSLLKPLRRRNPRISR